MTNYYTMEEEQPASTVTALDNWDSTVRSLADIAPQIAERVNQIGGQLGTVYNTAEALGDQQTMVLLGQSWATIQAMATQAVQLDNGIQTAKEVIGTLARKLDEVDGELAELERCVEAVDLRDARVDGLVDKVRAEVAADIQNHVEQAYAQAQSVDMYLNISDLTGITDWPAINAFLMFIEFGGKRTQKQVDLLTELVSTFERKEGRR